MAYDIRFHGIGLNRQTRCPIDAPAQSAILNQSRLGIEFGAVVEVVGEIDDGLHPRLAMPRCFPGCGGSVRSDNDVTVVEVPRTFERRNYRSDGSEPVPWVEDGLRIKHGPVGQVFLECVRVVHTFEQRWEQSYGRYVIRRNLAAMLHQGRRTGPSAGPPPPVAEVVVA